MNLWKIFGLASGIFLVTMIVRKRRKDPAYIDDPEKRYDTEDFLTEQEL
ncbi:MAG: hypothetical protein HY964_10630 [Ignavibacteriales bacterium]|nr:hypothetical protein [Ignavibacteriales bacterium]